jgi:kinesin family protein 6/9
MKKNEQVDAGVVIVKLKKEVKELKAELNLLKGGNQKEVLTSEDIERCNTMVNNFIKNDESAASLVLPDRLMINQCFYYFRTLYQNAAKKNGGALAITAGPEQTPSKAAKEEDTGAKDAEIQRLHMLIKQRDNEIGILLNYLNKAKESADKGEEYSTGVPVESSYHAKASTDVTQSESSSTK